MKDKMREYDEPYYDWADNIFRVIAVGQKRGNERFLERFGPRMVPVGRFPTSSTELKEPR